jgi:ankyrin repeat protein
MQGDQQHQKEAVIHGDSDMIRNLVQRGSSVNTYDKRVYTPLQYAAVKGNLEIIILLAEFSSRIDAGSKEWHIEYNFSFLSSVLYTQKLSL